MNLFLLKTRHLAWGNFQISRAWIKNHSKITQNRATDGHLLKRRAACLLAYQRQKCIFLSKKKENCTFPQKITILWIWDDGALFEHFKISTFTLHNTQQKTLHKRWGNECNLPGISDKVALCNYWSASSAKKKTKKKKTAIVGLSNIFCLLSITHTADGTSVLLQMLFICKDLTVLRKTARAT